MEIDENTITGNIQIVEEMNTELKLDPENPDYQKYIRIIAGDQLTIARQRAITGIRLGHEVGGTLLTHFGVSSVRSPGSLAWHNTCLERIPIVLTSLPSFRVCRDLIMVSLYARILHCLLLVSEEESLEDKFANADRVQELREPRLAEEKKAQVQEQANAKRKRKDHRAPR